MTALGLNLILESHPKNIAEVEPFVLLAFKQFEINESIFGNILITLTEAVSNAIIHGNRSEVHRKVYINSVSDSSRVTFTVEDEGSGFNPENLPDPTAPQNLMTPGGRGVFLMNQLADKVIYLQGGRIIQLEFNKI
jgi:serine/threonine-protein kinase RsbW